MKIDFLVKLKNKIIKFIVIELEPLAKKIDKYYHLYCDLKDDGKQNFSSHSENYNIDINVNHSHKP